MTAQRPLTSAPDARVRPTSTSRRQRTVNVAVSTAALPAVILSSVALADPAFAAVPTTAGPVLPKSPLAPLNAGFTAAVPASNVPFQIPARLWSAPRPSAHTVRSGDTVSGIASRYGVNTRSIVKLNRLDADAVIFPGQTLRLTSARSSAPAAKYAQAPRAASAVYVVKSGDTLGGIAARHGVSLNRLLRASGLRVDSIIYPGQRIRLGLAAAAAPRSARAATPAPAPAQTSAQRRSARTYVVKSGDTLGAIAARHGVSLTSVLTANGLNLNSVIYPGQKLRLSGGIRVTTQSSRPVVKPRPVAKKAPSSSYIVRSGDTLGAIADRHKVSLSSLLQANRLKLSSVIYPGNRLTIPGSATNAKPAKPATNLVPSTFLHYTYPNDVVAAANRNKAYLLSVAVPSPTQMRAIVADRARRMGVDPSLALAMAFQESGFDQRAVSPANAIGTMQVIPMSGEWASQLVGRPLNLLDPYDNATAGVAIIRALLRTSDSLSEAIGSYYQGQGSVQRYGLFNDTKAYVASVKAHQQRFR